MAQWNEIIYSGSNARLNQVTASAYKGDGSGITGVISSSYAQTSSFNNSIFSRGVTYFVSGGMNSTPEAFTVWRTPYPCRVVSLQAWPDRSNAISINARKSGSSGYSPHTTSFLLVTGLDWNSSNSVINTDYAANDTLQITITGSGATESRVSIQVNFIRI